MRWIRTLAWFVKKVEAEMSRTYEWANPVPNHQALIFFSSPSSHPQLSISQCPCSSLFTQRRVMVLWCGYLTTPDGEQRPHLRCLEDLQKIRARTWGQTGSKHQWSMSCTCHTQMTKSTKSHTIRPITNNIKDHSCVYTSSFTCTMNNSYWNDDLFLRRTMMPCQ